jgi:hypothetical protein
MTTEIEIKSETNICRICLDESEPEDMIHPCKCDGHSKYVHKECLKKWIKTSELHNKKCQICKTEYKKTGNKIIYSTILNRHREQLTNVFMCIYLIVIMYSAMIYALDVDKNLAKSVGIYNNDFLQEFRIYYILHYSIIMLIIINSIKYEIYQLDSDMRYKYILLPIKKKYLLFFLTIILYYSIGFHYTNFISDFFETITIHGSIIIIHNSKISKIDDIIDSVLNYDS